MNNNRISKNIKFKIDGLGFNVIPEKPIKPVQKKEETTVNDLHYHTMYELFYTDDEPITIYTAVNTFQYTNCIVCIPPFFKHQTIRKPGIRILFTYDKKHPDSPGVTQFMNSFFSKSEPFKIPCNRKMKFLFDELDCSFQTANHFSNEIIKSILILIFAKIYNENSLSLKDSYTPVNENYLITIDDIINDFQSDVNLQSLSDALHLSTKQTTRILKKNYNKKLSEIMTEKRLSVASELLVKSNMTIPEIVEYINFSSERYFYSQFKKAYGCTPYKYKKIQNCSN